MLLLCCVHRFYFGSMVRFVRHSWLLHIDFLALGQVLLLFWCRVWTLYFDFFQNVAFVLIQCWMHSDAIVLMLLMFVHGVCTKFMSFCFFFFIYFAFFPYILFAAIVCHNRIMIELVEALVSQLPWPEFDTGKPHVFLFLGILLLFLVFFWHFIWVK